MISLNLLEIISVIVLVLLVLVCVYLRCKRKGIGYKKYLDLNNQNLFTKNTSSNSLKEGISKSLLFIKYNLDNTNPKSTDIYDWFKKQLDSIGTVNQWANISSNITILCEIEPDLFLDRIEQEICYKKITTGFVELFPKHIRGEVERLLGLLNNSLYSFISGTLWLSLLLFVVSVIGFSIIGLNAPVLVAFVCVITNLIPYIGPYLGAAVAAAIGFSQGPLIGVLTLIFIFVVQTIEGNVLQPLVMSKKMNLSPITIIISLLVFEYLFGIVGMVVATPVVALLKIIYNFFDEKYNFFGKEKDEE